MLWFPGMTANKKWRPAKNRAHTSLVILSGKQVSSGFVISTSLINYLETCKHEKKLFFNTFFTK